MIRKLQFRRPHLFVHARNLIIPAVITAFFWLTSANKITSWQLLASLLLAYLPWHSYVQWKKGGRADVPLFAMISAVYALYYVVPLFWGDRIVRNYYSSAEREIPIQFVTRTMLAVLLGVSALGVGMRSHLGRALAPRNPPDIPPEPSRWNYLRVLMILGIIFGFFTTPVYLLGEGGRQAIMILLTVAPTVAFAILLRAYLRGRSNQLDKLLLLAFIASRFVAGLSSGWLGMLIGICITCVAVYLAERGRIPALSLILIGSLALFLQAGKEEFRNTYWVQEDQSGQTEKVAFWVDASLNKWGEALSDPTSGVLRDLLSGRILARVSLLTQSANVLELTPSTVPYQNGRLYSYMLVTFVPRAVWPDKPTVNEANQFYQVAYDLKPEDGLQSVSIAVGVLTEAYINFGWVGVPLVMFLLGVFLDFFQRTFFAKTSGLLFNAIGVVFLPLLLGIEAQMAQYLGGMVQQVVMILIVMLPLLRFRRTAHHAPLGVSFPRRKHYLPVAAERR